MNDVVMTADIDGVKFTLRHQGDYRWYDPDGQPTALRRLTESEAKRAMMFLASQMVRQWRERSE